LGLHPRTSAKSSGYHSQQSKGQLPTLAFEQTSKMHLSPAAQKFAQLENREICSVQLDCIQNIRTRNFKSNAVSTSQHQPSREYSGSMGSRISCLGIARFWLKITRRVTHQEVGQMLHGRRLYDRLIVQSKAKLISYPIYSTSTEKGIHSLQAMSHERQAPGALDGCTAKKNHTQRIHMIYRTSLFYANGTISPKRAASGSQQVTTMGMLDAIVY